MRLKQLRKLSGLTQEEVAELAGIPSITYQSIEAGRRPNVSINMAGKLAKAYELTISGLFEAECPKIKEMSRPPTPHRKRRPKVPVEE